MNRFGLVVDNPMHRTMLTLE